MFNANEIADILSQAFLGAKIEVSNDGARHKNHKEAKQHGGGHFRVLIIWDDFSSMNLIQRHQAIYQALQMPRPEIHALQITAKTQSEVEK